MNQNFIRVSDEGLTKAARKKLLQGCRCVREEFGPYGNGKTTRAEALAERLSAQGKSVIVVDDILYASGSGVRVYVKGGEG